MSHNPKTTTIEISTSLYVYRRICMTRRLRWMWVNRLRYIADTEWPIPQSMRVCLAWYLHLKCNTLRWSDAEVRRQFLWIVAFRYQDFDIHQTGEEHLRNLADTLSHDVLTSNAVEGLLNLQETRQSR